MRISNIITFLLLMASPLHAISKDTYDFGTISQDYGARMFESDGIRWGQMDPRAEVTPNVSPYVYCNSNPIRRLDHGGMFYGDYYDNNGQL